MLSADKRLDEKYVLYASLISCILNCSIIFVACSYYTCQNVCRFIYNLCRFILLKKRMVERIHFPNLVKNRIFYSATNAFNNRLKTVLVSHDGSGQDFSPLFTRGGKYSKYTEN